MNDMIILTITCPFCRKEHKVRVSEDDYFNYRDGKLTAQNAFPYLSATEREQLISYLCPACQATIFKEED